MQRELNSRKSKKIKKNKKNRIRLIFKNTLYIKTTKNL